jgi:Glycosyl transferase family 90
MAIRLIPRGNPKILYYARVAFREMQPKAMCRHLLERRLAQASLYDAVYLEDRLSYCNKLSLFPLPPKTVQTAGRLDRTRTLYFYDLNRYARYFDPKLKLSHLFGDIIDVPEEPTIVKSRPINGNNVNSVLMKLDRNRHFFFPSDPLSFASKKPMAVWRGTLNNDRRAALIKGFSEHPHCDVGQVSGRKMGFTEKKFMPVKEQLQYRFILSVEGVDVATNLKWGMNSNSLCFSPKLRFETWFMEGRLKAGVHFVEVKDDFSDLVEKIDYYNDHVEEAAAIISNANAWVAQFKDELLEDLLSLMVLRRYFERTGQI